MLPQVREIGFEGSGLDEALLLWDVAAIAAHTFMNGIANFASAEPRSAETASRHWVLASWTDEEVLRRCTLTPEERAYLRCAGGMAGKHSGDGKTTVQQFDPPRRRPTVRSAPPDASARCGGCTRSAARS